MKSFKDNAGHDWHISLNIGTAMLVKDRLNIDLLQPEKGDPPLITQLGTDEYLLAQVISVLLESQFESQKVDETQIYQFFDGTTFARATSTAIRAGRAFVELFADDTMLPCTLRSVKCHKIRQKIIANETWPPNMGNCFQKTNNLFPTFLYPMVLRHFRY